MLKVERQNRLRDDLAANGVISIEDICRRYQVSVNTARSDAAALVAEGTAVKTYGGICIPEVSSGSLFREFRLRSQGNREAKKSIGRRAAAFVEEGDVIFIDSGTTTSTMVEYLAVQHLTVVTNNLSVVEQIAEATSFNLICIGELYRRENNSFYMENDHFLLKKYNINKCFFSTAGISNNGRVTSALVHEYNSKKALKENTGKSFLLADASKFGKAALFSYATLSELDVLVTDRELSPELAEICRGGGTQVEITGNA